MKSSPFERMAEAYDGWFETERGKLIFRLETDCIRDLLEETTRPWLEVGVGTGRFAAALHVDVGVDSSPAVLRIAGQRVIDLATHAGLFFCRAVSGLVERPEQTVESYACPKDGIIGNAGFVAMLFGSEHEGWQCCTCTNGDESSQNKETQT